MPIFGGARQTFLCSDMKADRGKIWGKEVGKILKNKSSFRTKKTQTKTKKEHKVEDQRERAGQATQSDCYLKVVVPVSPISHLICTSYSVVLTFLHREAASTSSPLQPGQNLVNASTNRI